jgi:hypothetical protein
LLSAAGWRAVRNRGAWAKAPEVIVRVLSPADQQASMTRQANVTIRFIEGAPEQKNR